MFSFLTSVFWAFRPAQLPKNGLTLVPLVFTIDLWWDVGDIADALAFIWRGFGAFGVFVLISGAIYVMNDILDAEEDRTHPVKRFRPTASGRVSARAIGVIGVAVAAAGLAGGFLISNGLGYAATGYIILNVIYSTWLKRMVIADVIAIAIGFATRSIGGAAALTGATEQALNISPWLYIVTGFGALLIAILKRRAELLASKQREDNTRYILEKYTEPLLDQLTAATATAVITTYSLYSFQRQVGNSGIGEAGLLMLTIPFVVYGVFRYLYLAYVKGQAEAPETVLLKDKPLQICIGLWLLASAVILLFAG